MFTISPQLVAQMSVTVTSTATLLYALADTAGGATSSARQYYITNACDVISIRPENGDIRVAFGVTPTASVGTIIKQGTKQYLKGDVNTLKLIRTGAVNVTCEIGYFAGKDMEIETGVVSEVSLIAGTISIGEVQGAAATTTSSGTQAVDATAGGTQVVAANTNRAYTEFTNTGGFVCYYGTGTVTSSFQQILPSQTKAWNSQQALKVLSSSGSINIAFVDYINS